MSVACANSAGPLYLKKKLGRASVDKEDCRDFTLGELRKALKKMKRKGAEGPDGIPPSFLKELGPKALNELLEIFNSCYRTSYCPQIWKLAIIIPLLKADKLASDLASFRPISLTSCISKCFERMFAERLYHYAETVGIFDSQQAGFRKGRGCDDQIALITQAIQDGLNRKERSVLVLLDFSKAYDTIWREKLLLTMIEDGVPMIMVRWLASFLQNRQGQVKFSGVLSGKRYFKQGLPQGSVLSPILFLFYINQLAKILPRETLNSLFADDVSALATEKTKERAEGTAQTTVDVVSDWAQEWKVSLNAGKSETSFFSTSNREAHWMPLIFVWNDRVKQIKNPCLLGVYLDRTLHFGYHVDKLIEKTESKNKMLRAVANTEWGWKKDKLTQVFSAHATSTAEYAGFAWMPSAAPTHLNRLERAQNKLLRTITGQYKATRTEALRLECGLPGFKTSADRLALKAAEKAIRLPEEHPRKLAYEGVVGHTRKQSNWRTRSHQLARQLPRDLVPRANINYFPCAPWITAPMLTVYPFLEGVESRLDEIQIKKEATLARIREVSADIVVYTDGSASQGIYQGGSGVVITKGTAESPEVIHTIRRKGANYTSSYEEEVDGMLTAAVWISLFCQKDASILICTDSQSLCMALDSYNVETSPIRSALHNRTKPVTIQWIPGHSEVPGNDLADAAAKAGTELQGASRPTSYRASCMMVKKSVPNVIQDRLVREVYKCFSLERDKEELLTRKDQVLMAQIRSGKHKAFKSYEHMLDSTKSDICTRCTLGAVHNLEHWFMECPGTYEAKYRLFFDEKMEEGLGLLTKCPGKSVALAKQTLLGAELGVQ